MERRDFLKKGCFACLAIAGSGAISSLLSSCASLPSITAETRAGKLLMERGKFPVDTNMLLVRSSQLDNDILLIKCKEGKLHGLLMQCTHNNSPLSPTSSGIFCHSHNAEFDMDGNVRSGPPKQALRRFQVTQDEQFITIHLTQKVEHCSEIKN